MVVVPVEWCRRSIPLMVGNGGAGIQLPATFRDCIQSVGNGPTSAGCW